jgi:hypothetical protein
MPTREPVAMEGKAEEQCLAILEMTCSEVRKLVVRGEVGHRSRAD